MDSGRSSLACTDSAWAHAPRLLHSLETLFLRCLLVLHFPRAAAKLAVGLVFLYNPLIPVHLGSKPLWTAINVATVFYFSVLEYAASRKSSETRSGGS
jgi:hypothetical protein